MKGGKAGRKRPAGSGHAKPNGAKRDPGKAPRADRASGAPKKGERRKPFGGRSSSGEEL
jgi:hypothetical protein